MLLDKEVLVCLKYDYDQSVIKAYVLSKILDT